MKKITALALVLCMLAGCSLSAPSSTDPTEKTSPTTVTTTPTEEPTTVAPTVETLPPVDYEALYAPLLSDFSYLLRYFATRSHRAFVYESHPCFSDTMGTILADPGDAESGWQAMVDELQASGARLKPDQYGYLIYDFNGDTVPELFWLDPTGGIVAVFTCFEGQVRLLSAYWSRCRGFVRADGLLCVAGSSGAASGSYDAFAIEKGKLVNVCGFSVDGTSYYERTANGTVPITAERYAALSRENSTETSPVFLSQPVSPLPALPSAQPESTRDVPYLIKITRADLPHFRGPGYETGFTEYLRTPGTYTVLEEYRDSFGNLWGRMKSGAGWLDLTRLEKEEAAAPLVAITQGLPTGSYHNCAISSGSYAAQITLLTKETVTNVEVFFLDCTEGYRETTPQYHLDTWTPDTPLLVTATYSGDMSVYAIRVTDSDGFIHRYAIWENLSGEGAPFTLSTYYPT